MRRRVADFNFWPSVADTMLVAFIILLGLWFGYEALTKLEDASGSGGIKVNGDEWTKFNRHREQLPHLEKELVAVRTEISQLRADIEDKDEAIRIAECRIEEFEKQKGELDKKLGSVETDLAQAKAQNDKPPIINLPESQGYSFSPSSVVVTEKFTTLLKGKIFVVNRKNLDRPDVNAIEIIGHTDGQSVLPAPRKASERNASNLDWQLGSVLSGKQKPEMLEFGSNADLGLGRAVAVRGMIEAWLKEYGLSEKIRVRCYSAANSVPLSDHLDDPKVFTGKDDARRRIEIRFTHLDPSPADPPPAGR